MNHTGSLVPLPRRRFLAPTRNGTCLHRERHASENLDFKEAVERFRSSFSPGIPGSDDDAEPVGPFLSPRPDKEDVFPVSSQAVTARKIVRRFVQQEAPEQVRPGWG